MKLQQLLQSFEFEEFYPEIGLMYPNARRQRASFKKAFEIMINMKAVSSKKIIRYQLMQDPDTNEMFFGADDTCFKGPWEVVIGKELKRDPQVDLTDAQLAANCLLNLILISRHPQSFETDYLKITR